MIKGIDSNILLRIVLRDDEAQLKKAVKFVQNNTSFINLIVLTETTGVLRKRIRVSNAEIAKFIEYICYNSDFMLENGEIVYHALEEYKKRKFKINFEDILIALLNNSYDCKTTVTFDLEAAEYNGFELL